MLSSKEIMKYYRKLVGKKCYLSPISVEDADQYCIWLNDIDVIQFINFWATIELGKRKDDPAGYDKEWCIYFCNSRC